MIFGRDPETVLIILAIKKICNQNQVPIVAEIHDPDKAELARFVGGLGTGQVEIVSSKLVAQNLLAQVVVTPGLTNVYNDLLTFGENSMEIYGQKVPKQFIGKTFDDIVKDGIGSQGKRHSTSYPLQSRETEKRSSTLPLKQLENFWKTTCCSRFAIHERICRTCLRQSPPCEFFKRIQRTTSSG